MTEEQTDVINLLRAELWEAQAMARDAGYVTQPSAVGAPVVDDLKAKREQIKVLINVITESITRLTRVWTDA